MGCRKLTYQGTSLPLKVVYNDLIINANSYMGGYRYGFQGQERDDEIKGKGNSLNYSFRMHDPRVGRFFAVDPLALEYPYYSPYQFSSNSVIVAIELEGLESSIQLNYSEFSVTITRDQHNRLSISRIDFFKLPSGTGRMPAYDSYSSVDLSSPNRHVDVWVQDFFTAGAFKGEGRWMRINLPNDSEIIQRQKVSVTEDAPVTKWEERSVNGVEASTGDFYPEYLDEVKSKFDSEIGDKGPNYRVSKISISLGGGVSEKEKGLIHSGLKDLYGNQLEIEYFDAGSWDSVASFRLETIEIERIVLTKVTKIETKEVVVPAVEIEP